MISNAVIPSPLGAILLQADAQYLVGLYFVGQRDCPDLPGRPSMHSAVPDPAAGTTHGRPTRLLRVIPATEAAPGGSQGPGDLFGPAELDIAVLGDASPAGPFGALTGDPTDALKLQQDDTPEASLTVLRQAQRELAEYFAGQRKVFDVPMAPPGTAFQRKVWDALLTIPCGQTVSYGDVALRAGMEARHSRPVGAAVGANPISILIPCHRVLASNHSLNGYGGGLNRKIRLLELEGFAIR